MREKFSVRVCFISQQQCYRKLLHFPSGSLWNWNSAGGIESINFTQGFVSSRVMRPMSLLTIYKASLISFLIFGLIVLELYSWGPCHPALKFLTLPSNINCSISLRWSRITVASEGNWIFYDKILMCKSIVGGIATPLQSKISHLPC